MRKINVILITLSLLILISCSNYKKKNIVEEFIEVRNQSKISQIDGYLSPTFTGNSIYSNGMLNKSKFITTLKRSFMLNGFTNIQALEIDGDTVIVEELYTNNELNSLNINPTYIKQKYIVRKNKIQKIIIVETELDEAFQKEFGIFSEWLKEYNKEEYQILTQNKKDSAYYLIYNKTLSEYKNLSNKDLIRTKIEEKINRRKYLDKYNGIWKSTLTGILYRFDFREEGNYRLTKYKPGWKKYKIPLRIKSIDKQNNQLVLYANFKIRGKREEHIVTLKNLNPYSNNKSNLYFISISLNHDLIFVRNLD